MTGEIVNKSGHQNNKHIKNHPRLNRIRYNKMEVKNTTQIVYEIEIPSGKRADLNPLNLLRHCCAISVITIPYYMNVVSFSNQIVIQGRESCSYQALIVASTVVNNSTNRYGHQTNSCTKNSSSVNFILCNSCSYTSIRFCC